MTTMIDTTTIAPIDHDEAMTLARLEYARIAQAFAALGDDDWQRPTDCSAWTVRDLGGHVAGAMQSAASLRTFLRQNRTATKQTKAHGGAMVDHLTALQVAENAALGHDALVAELARLVEPAATGRARIPGLARRLVSFRIVFADFDERWRLGYLNDIILNRDIWLHRVDLARAVGTEPVLDDDHDARIVADVVAEWARRHGQPFVLQLHGPAGGRFSAGTAPTTNEIELDAVEFCRILSGRAPGTGLLGQAVPF